MPSVLLGQLFAQVTSLVFLIFNSTFISVKFEVISVLNGRHYLSLCIILTLQHYLGLR